MGWNVVSEELGEFIEILPPQKRVGEHWYLGTADAVYQNLYSITREEPANVLILSCRRDARDDRSAGRRRPPVWHSRGRR
jgi:ADP-glucose pyrophosphorylase